MPDLRAFLERTFSAAGGAMPFDEFMAAALYNPEHGYYTTGIAEVGGERGDFATSATLSNALGKAVAGWIVGEIDHHRWRGPVEAIEVGGGNGALAAAVRKALGWSARRRVRHRLVEISPVLRGLQQGRLGRAAVWHSGIEEALAAAGGKALIYSNELVDAFPAKWLRWNGSSWDEIHVVYDATGGLREEFRPLPDKVTTSDFSSFALADRVPGQRIEILPSYRNWLEGLGGAWKEGSILTIDYGGASAAEIYSRRPAGTMRAYFKHQRVEGGSIYARFGRQDLTADVNFDDLVRWGESLGLETVRLQTQREFLARFGAEGDATAGPGPGESFLVLEQRRPATRHP